MKMSNTVPQNIDDYIADFPPEIQEILQRVRETIRKAAPDAEETISYNIPTFNLKGHYLIYFAGYKKHIGLYPVPIGNEELKEEMAPYVSGKGTLKFPLDKPIPYGLIRKLVKFRIRENLARIKAAKK